MRSCAAKVRAYMASNAKGLASGAGVQAASSAVEASRHASDASSCCAKLAPSDTSDSTSSIQEAGFMPAGRACEPGTADRYATSDAPSAPTGPKYAIQPPRCMSSMSSKLKNTSVLGWWMVVTTVRPVLVILRTTRMTMAAARASRLLVGSSRKRMGALDTSSTATVRILRCEGDNPPGAPGRPTRRPATGRSSSRSMTSSTKAARTSGATVPGRRSAAEKWSASATVASGECTSCCSQYAVRRAKLLRSSGKPFRLMLPSVTPAVLRHAMTSSSVVLPAPEAPMSASSRPGCATPDTSCSSCLRPLAVSTVYDSARHASAMRVKGSVPTALSGATASLTASPLAPAEPSASSRV